MTDHNAKVVLVAKLSVWLAAPKEVRALGQEDGYIYSHRNAAHLILENYEWDPKNLGPVVLDWIYGNVGSLVVRVHFYDDPLNTWADIGEWEDCPVKFERDTVTTLYYRPLRGDWSETICGHVLTDSREDSFLVNKDLGVRVVDSLPSEGTYTCSAQNVHEIEVMHGHGNSKEAALLDLIEELKRTRDGLSERIRRLEHK